MTALEEIMKQKEIDSRWDDIKEIIDNLTDGYVISYQMGNKIIKAIQDLEDCYKGIA